ncbi:MAG: GNAT family N-acetyltransferase [Hyphomicrobiales bacterium]
MPYGFDVLKREASKEGFSLIDRLVNEWHNHVNQFNKEGELLLAAYLDGDLAAIGDLSKDPYIAGALRMRRFYTRENFRGIGIGAKIAEILIVNARRAKPTIIIVNAVTVIAPVFWEAQGFSPRAESGHMHVLEFY